MLGNVFTGFEKRAEEKKKNIGAGKGALIGGALGALPLAALAALNNTGNKELFAMLAGAGGLTGAGLGGLAGAAADRVDSAAAKGALAGAALGATPYVGLALLMAAMGRGSSFATADALNLAAKGGLAGAAVGGLAGGATDAWKHFMKKQKNGE